MTQKRKAMSRFDVNVCLKKIPGWKLKAGKLVRVCDFSTYVSGLKFVQWLGQEAEKMDHHPNIVLDYKKVTVTYSTHSVKGLTALDFEAAKRIEKHLTLFSRSRRSGT
jgi:4a-hydroxytetrahydrobiopterin dehydratase